MMLNIFKYSYLLVFISLALSGCSRVIANDVNDEFLTTEISQIYGDFKIRQHRVKNSDRFVSTISASKVNTILTIPYIAEKAPLIKLFNSGNTVYLLSSIFKETGVGDSYGWAISLYKWPNPDPIIKMLSSNSPKLEDFNDNGNIDLVIEQNAPQICIECAGWPYIYSLNSGGLTQEKLSDYPMVIDTYRQKVITNREAYSDLCHKKKNCQFDKLIWYLDQKIAAIRSRND